MKLFLALALLCFAIPGLTVDIANPAAGEPGARVTEKKTHPAILLLEQDLTHKLAEKKDGRVTPEQYQAWKSEFRAHLDATMARVPPSPDNTAAHIRITVQLGEREQAQATLDHALEQNPESPVLLRTKSQILYEQKDFPGAAHNGLQAWEKSGRTDQGAWALYQLSKGRSAPSGTASSSPGLSPLMQGPPVVSADDSNKPFKLAVKGSALPSTVPVPGQAETEPLKREGGLPLWPLAVPFAGGLIAYGLYRGSKQTDAHETEQPPVGALIAAPGLVVEPANIAGGVIRNVAKGSAIKTLCDIAFTGLVAAGILVAGGPALILPGNPVLNAMIAAQDKYNEAIDTHRDDRPSAANSPDRLPAIKNPDDRSVYVVRGGIATPRSLKETVDKHMHPSGVVGFSVQSAPGRTVTELAAAGQFPHKQISVTTVARLAAVGVRLVPTAGTGYHKTAATPRPLADADAARISAAFDPPIPNPAPVNRGSAAE